MSPWTYRADDLLYISVWIHISITPRDLQWGIYIGMVMGIRTRPWTQLRSGPLGIFPCLSPKLAFWLCFCQLRSRPAGKPLGGHRDEVTIDHHDLHDCHGSLWASPFNQKAHSSPYRGNEDHKVSRTSVWLDLPIYAKLLSTYTLDLDVSRLLGS